MIDRLSTLPVEARQQVLAFATLSLMAAGAVAVLSLSHGAFFQLFFGSIPPVVAIILVIVAGAASLYPLYRGGWFMVLNAACTLRGIAFSAAVVALFAVEVTILDTVIRFPADTNVPLPQALLFYPAMAYVVEIVFHTVPLALLLFIFGRQRERASSSRLLTFCIILTAVLEPSYQLAFLDSPISWTALYLWSRLFVFNLVQLRIFRRFDFVSMYSFRFLYYAYWHIAWGHFRLQVLF